MITLSRSKFLRHVRGLRTLATVLRIESSVVVETALTGWASRAFPTLKPSGFQCHKQLAHAPKMVAFCDELDSLPFLEAAYWLSSAYAQLSSDDRRKSLSMYFTPPSLTARLLDDLENRGVAFGVGVFFDPACGGAAFLASIALRMKSHLLNKGQSALEILRHVESHLLGTDLDPTLCALSRQFLRMSLAEEIAETGYEPSFKIMIANSLQETSHLIGKIDVVVCNPPYRKMQAPEVAKHRVMFDEVIEAQPNVYGLFIALCIKLLRAGGTCALVTPTSFLSGQNFSKLRNYLVQQVYIEQIGMVSERLGVFIDVEQETALTILRRKQKDDLAIRETFISVVSPDGKYVNVGACTIQNSSSPWPIPRREDDVSLLQKSSKLKHRISDYGYRIRIGTFVWNRDERPVYMSAATAKRCKSGTAVPLLWSSDIKPQGRLHFDGLKKANKEPRFVNFGTREHQSVVRNHSVLLQRVTSNEQPRRLVAAAIPNDLIRNYSGFVGENHTVILEKTSSTALFSPEQMAYLLNTETIDRCFRCISGATNVSVYELSNLPLPDPTILIALLSDGVSMDNAIVKAMLATPIPRKSAPQKRPVSRPSGTARSSLPAQAH